MVEKLVELVKNVGSSEAGPGIEASNDRVVLIRIHVSASDFTHILVGMPIMFIYVDDT